MNFIKNVSKSVGEGVNIVTLDNIVEDILDKYKKELDETVKSRETLLTVDEAEKIEAEWFVIRNESYDRRASKAIGKSIPDNWKDDKDLLCVRKRMLNRELDKLKGQLLIRIEEYNVSSKKLYLLVLRVANDSLNKFQEEITTKFPMSKGELELAMHLNKQSIMSQVTENAPNMDKLAVKFSNDSITDSNLSWAAFQTRLTVQVPEYLNSSNEIVKRSFINSIKSNSIDKLKQAIFVQFEQNKTIFLNSLREVSYLTDMEISSLSDQYNIKLLSKQRDIMNSLSADEIPLEF